jgi:methylglyoxal synthase
MDFRFLRVENMKIAIIAHDGKKAEMVHFLMRHKAFLSLANIDLVATGTTGKDVESAGLVVEKVMSGPLGGDAQIAAMVTEGKVEMVFFFRDPLDKHPHEPDIIMLMRICDVYNVPLATNPATAEGLLKGLENDIIA